MTGPCGNANILYRDLSQYHCPGCDMVLQICKTVPLRGIPISSQRVQAISLYYFLKFHDNYLSQINDLKKFLKNKHMFIVQGKMSTIENHKSRKKFKREQ